MSPPLVVSLAFDRMSLFESGIAAEVFGLERPELPGPLYRFAAARIEAGPLRTEGGLRLQADGGLELLRRADRIVVPGWRDGAQLPPPALLDALRAAHRRGAHLLSICSGAFVLAAAGLLDGRPATTHWQHAELLARAYPRVRVMPEVLYVDDGEIVTSAGSAAGIDACLHVVRKDYGADIAAMVARTMVCSPHRSGGQAQFIPAPVPARAERGLAPVMEWAAQQLKEGVTVADMAARAAMSERTFLRRFAQEAGTTPKSWLTRQRIAAAQALLESSKAGLDDVLAATGFGSMEAFRLAFRQVVGVPPSAYRAQFRTGRLAR